MNERWSGFLAELERYFTEKGERLFLGDKRLEFQGIAHFSLIVRDDPRDEKPTYAIELHDTKGTHLIPEMALMGFIDTFYSDDPVTEIKIALEIFLSCLNDDIIVKREIISYSAGFEDGYSYAMEC